MLPGPTYIYECPNCKQKFSKGSLKSGNTFGAVRFSDGYINAPMLPKFPKITKCKNCDTYFWLKNEIDKIRSFSKVKSKYPNCLEAYFLNTEEYIEVLEQKKYSSIEDEIYLRQHLLWSINSPKRNKKIIIPNFKHKKIRQENAERLLKILDLNIPEQRLLMAELHRNSGNFEKCIELLDNLEGYEKTKNQFKIKCQKKNTKVFKFNYK